jgi:hypothetical protein
MPVLVGVCVWVVKIDDPGGNYVADEKKKEETYSDVEVPLGKDKKKVCQSWQTVIACFDYGAVTAVFFQGRYAHPEHGQNQKGIGRKLSPKGKVELLYVYRCWHKKYPA